MIRFHAPRALFLGLTLLLSACAGTQVRTPPAEAVVVEASATEVAAAAETLGEPPVLAEDTVAVETVASAASPAAEMTIASDEGVAGEAMLASAPSPQDTPPTGAPTVAEDDFNALYGNPEYDPVADPTLPPGVELPSSYDPWEPLNRRVHAFNNFFDGYVATPLAKLYVKALPRPVRLGVSNFFNNLGQPISATNALLQGRPKDAGFALLRFGINSTLGIGGLFDVASRMKIPYRDEDFGQTLAVWGWRKSRYVELPIFGPRTVRDIFGMVGDVPLSPLRHIGRAKAQVALRTLQLGDIRARLFAVDRMREGAADDYALYRDAWLQRRNYQIMSDLRATEAQDDNLPDYLNEEIENPDVPIDAIPIQP